MIHINNNTCPICLTDNLKWNLNISKSDIQMFKCGHGTCKECYIKLRNINTGFSCPCCREKEQEYLSHFSCNKTEKWTTFSEWYNDYEIFITCGQGKNVIKNSSFGKQLIRLCKERKRMIK